VTGTLQTSGLSFAVGGATIVDEVSLTLGESEFLGVIGPNGAGKTTLFDLLSGLAKPGAGTITLAGRDVTGASPERRARLGLGRTFQTSSVFEGLAVAENVRLAAAAHQGGSAKPWGRPGGRRAAGRALEQVGLTGQAAAPARSLSHGDKRKLELAILLATEPRVVLLDEPMAGVSAEDVPELIELISRVQRERGTTTVMVERHMDVILTLADRVAVMHHGALIACDTPAKVMADETVQSTYLGEGP
jgi:branched-chain amino acid transport system ATP-binding protein